MGSQRGQSMNFKKGESKLFSIPLPENIHYMSIDQQIGKLST